MSICCMCDFPGSCVAVRRHVRERSVPERGPFSSLVNAKYSVAVTSALPHAACD